MKKHRFRAGRALAAAAVAAFAAALICYPSDAMSYAREGLEICAKTIVPSLFPFFALASLVVELGYAKSAARALGKIMRPLYGLCGECAAALALGLIGGYPTGARTAVELYSSGQCSKEDAERLLGFCNNCGPAFILGVAGAGVFRSARVGVFLCLVHAAAALLVGLLFRRRGGDSGARAAAAEQPAGFAESFARSVASALRSTLSVSAYVVLFTVIIRLLERVGALGAAAGLLGRLPFLDEATARQILTGFVEISSGIWSLSSGGSFRARLAVAAFILGWGGLSVHCQALSFIEPSGLSTRRYFVGKFAHGAISAALAYFFGGIVDLGGSIATLAPSASGGGAPVALAAWLVCAALAAAMAIRSRK